MDTLTNEMRVKWSDGGPVENAEKLWRVGSWTGIISIARTR